MLFVLNIEPKNGIAYHIGDKKGKTLCGDWVAFFGKKQIKKDSDINDTMIGKMCPFCKDRYIKGERDV